jgi:hypothetical protein
MITPSKYVFRSKGLDTNTTRSVNKIDKIAKTSIDSAEKRLKLNNAKVLNRKNELNLRKLKIGNDKTRGRRVFSNSLAHTSDGNLKQIKSDTINTRPTYIK